MQEKDPNQLKYLELLSEKFPTTQAAFTEIINLEAILNLPKGTEHFVSDVHGEYEAFEHILNNCSGVIRERVEEIFNLELTASEQADLCTLVYYPAEKLRRLREEGTATSEWYAITLMRLVRLARRLSGSYTRSKVRKAMPVAYAYIIDELLHISPDEREARLAYHQRIIDTIIDTGSADDFICSLAALIKRLAVDHMHLVGDIFDRGPHADKICDRLMGYHSIDVEWGNHDIVWMGAASGSAACLAAVIRNNIHYESLSILESAYGVSLRELALFSEATYTQDDGMTPMEKAISVILFKLEGQVIMRHPNWHMEDRLLLEHVDPARGVLDLNGTAYEMRTRDFPTLDPAHPYELSADERRVMDGLMDAVHSSDKLRAHIGFLYDHGSAYLVRNGNAIFHACVPMNEDGTFCAVRHQDQVLAGREYYDYADRLARQAWHEHDQVSLDWMWYLWCGRYSPLSGRVVKTFERTYLTDRFTWQEPRDPYFRLTEKPEVARRILMEFGADPVHGHIINGHTPVHAADGESPVKAGGLLVVIDGGFCQAYHRTTGIAGYTLISDPRGMRIKAHRPFGTIADVLDLNADIMSDDDRFEIYPSPKTIGDTDTGTQIRGQVADLRALLDAYRTGLLPERG
ncbi:fructose-bisphosphatase class III [Olsenella sp. AF16-14LB]|jgi:fructose-1,6-bisphosphatase-3|uniref:fructose-bisphosphatase class III n=1 Tax=unclassified Olsenella TaxID=2638792 RepID=UPI0005099424|nr:MULTISPECIES: fructose-bisphosphatase class III [unclassified Olsenella]RGJ46531.1 fructose-bisphosphatase class III [Olsenella sp. TM06-36]RGU52141.1 fructose-bisphosphatase class III [Olsenella sp. AF16-14LB]RGU83277.1 fructose-bisphosphatase class III [Olsenella sp. AF15-43LB]RHJ93836.1 fructose-bisphosphatase class III [Olsenella sp. AM05-7]RHJ99527.1 fructose-bisphosphatase class III [Olsenella sp. AM05-17]